MATRTGALIGTTIMGIAVGVKVGSESALPPERIKMASERLLWVGLAIVVGSLIINGN